MASVLFGWFRRAARREQEGLPDAWKAAFDRIPWIARLTPEERARLERAALSFAAEKSFEGCRGLVVTDEMKAVISVHAAMLALNLPGDVYHRVRSILVYPSAFVNPATRLDAQGIAHEGTVEAGEAWHQSGPVIVAWDSARNGAYGYDVGRNVLFHEFAHKHDMLDGWADGTPSIAHKADYDAWRAVMAPAFADLQRDVRRGRPDVLDPYGTTNPAEFFAVATEAFFDHPEALRRRHPDLFDRLASYYRYSPVAHDPDARGDRRT